MLQSLSIQNIILIDSLTVNFGDNLCILSGETGAGKSILMGALAFALGGRSSSKLLGSHGQQGSATAQFDISSNKIVKQALNDAGIALSDELLLRRTIYKDGKTRAFINDTPVNVQLVASIAQHLLEIHGQHDQRGLLDKSFHLAELDRYANLKEDKKKLQEAYYHYKNICSQLSELELNISKAKEEQDYLKHVIKEIETLAPQDGEEEQLTKLRLQLQNHEKIQTALYECDDLLNSDTTIERSISKAQSILSSNSELHESFAEINNFLDKALIEFNEATSLLHECKGQLNAGEHNLEHVEERLFLLKATARKYQVTVDELDSYLDKQRMALELTSNADMHITELKKSKAIAYNSYMELAEKVSLKRKNAATKLAKNIKKELSLLHMDKVSFEVDFIKLEETQMNHDGFDKVEFVISTNPGMPLSPLAKIASGGELSRFMLALKLVLASKQEALTLIFDEIDTGIGGKVASSVGKRLEELGKFYQILVITHQPQVACRGNFHLNVLKESSNNIVRTSVRQLDENDKLHEIARMLAGDEISSEAIDAAQKLISS